MTICSHCGEERRQRRNSCEHCGRVDLEALRSIRISYEVNPSRMNNVPPRTPNNSFEKGIRKDERGVPYLRSNGTPLKLGESFNSRHYGEHKVSIGGGNS